MTALKRLFGDGFGDFFLATGLFAVGAWPLWEARPAGLLALALALGLALALALAAPPLPWHAHQTVCRYGAAVLGSGGVGGRRLAPMSHAHSGHSGRALMAPRPVALARALAPLALAPLALVPLALAPLAAVARVVGVLVGALCRPGGTTGGPTGRTTGGPVWNLAPAGVTAPLWPALPGPRAPRRSPPAAP